MGGEGVGLSGIQSTAETLYDGSLENGRDVLKKGCVDEVAAAVLEEAGTQVEIAQGLADGSFARAAGKGRFEGEVAADAASGQWCLIGEKDVTDEGICQLGDFCGVGRIEFAPTEVEVVAGVINSLDEAVDEADLVLVDEMGKNVTGWYGVFGPTEIAAGGSRDFLQVAGYKFAVEIAPMILDGVGAGDMPASEAFLERNAVTSGVAPKRIEAATVGAGDYGLQKETRDAA